MRGRSGFRRRSLVLTLAIGVPVVAAGIGIWLYVAFLRGELPPVTRAAVVSPAATPRATHPPSQAHPGQASLVLQTVASYGHPPHPDWVSYFSRTPGKAWSHSTVFQVPAYSYVRVTVYQFDTATGLRNPFWSQARGLSGGTFTVDGKTVPGIPAAAVSHTWGVVGLHLSVPLKGVADNAPKQCVAGPCPNSDAHTTTTFTFYSGPPRTYQWQCFVPCALGFIFGNGGPMQTVGWMDGFLRVV